MPLWFLQNCVKTAEELATMDIPLRIAEDFPHEASSKEHYEVPAVVYEPLANVLRPFGFAFKSPTDSSAAPNVPMYSFRKDVVYVRFARDSSQEGSRLFFRSVIQHFAKSAGADLINLCLDDLIDLLPLLRLKSCHAVDLWELGSEGAFAVPGVTFLLDAPNHKRGQEQNHLLVVHVEVPDIEPGKSGQNLLNALGNMVHASHGRAILIFTTDRRDLSPSSCFLSCCAFNGAERLFESSMDSSELFGKLRLSKNAICMAPRSTPQQRRLLSSHTALERHFESQNIRFLQRNLVNNSTLLRAPAVLQPYAQWDIDQNSSFRTALNKSRLTSDEMRDIVDAVGQNAENLDSIELAFNRLRLRSELLSKWTTGSSDLSTTDSDEVQTESSGHGDEDEFEARSLLHDSVQRTIRDIKDDGDKEAESRMLAHLVMPSEFEEGFAHISVETSVKEKMQRLVAQSSAKVSESYGILRHQRAGGILVYGPPGTGKTHLARVIAFESKASMLSVSPADLLIKWVGDTEAAIKALFSLARLLHPCLLFFDEADSLFRARTGDDRSWEVSKVNQLLHEMEGLQRSKRAPIVILATNFPDSLDSAVLRRAPGRVYLGLPHFEQRLEIFKICLREEVLHDDCDLDHLTLRTRGYSGSDIRNVCILAAELCDEQVSDEDGRRLMKQAHFLRALRDVHPTVSAAALENIQSFAARYDPPTFARFATEELQKTPIFEAFASMPGHSRSGNAFRHLRGALPSSGSEFVSNLAPLKERFMAGCGENAASHQRARLTAEEIDLPEVAFRYSPLKPQSMEIRVLKLHPGAPEDILRCELKVVDLGDWSELYNYFVTWCDDEGVDDVESYRVFLWQHLHTYLSSNSDDTPSPLSREQLSAVYTRCRQGGPPITKKAKIPPRFSWGDYVSLSYVWGHEEPCKEIDLDGHRFSVRPNLYAALRNLRDSFEVKDMGFYVWADAICINQSNMAEREAEVKKMGMIYSQCMKVIAWLGSPPPEIAAQVPKLMRLLEVISVADLDLGTKECCELVFDFDAQQSIIDVGKFMIRNAYWQRLWTVQEMCLAPFLVFHIDGFEFGPWCATSVHQLLVFTMFTEDADLQQKTFMQDWPQYYAVTIRVHATKSLPLGVFWPKWDIGELIELAKNSKATDHRDLVYGLVGILPHQVRDLVQVSYSPAVSVEDAFVSFTKACITGLGNLEILTSTGRQTGDAAHSVPHIEKPTGRPSWVPNLDRTVNSNHSTFSSVIPGNRTSTNNDLLEHNVCFSADDRHMICDGVVLDRVRSLGAMWLTKADSEEAQGDIGTEERNDQSKDLRLSLARVLQTDPTYLFHHGHSLLDMPWLDEEDLEEAERLIAGQEEQGPSNSNRSAWLRSYATNSALKTIYERILLPNRRYKVGDQNFESYFASLAKSKHPRKVLGEDLSRAREVFRMHRLFSTTSGILGHAPEDTALGDCIAIISRCSEPLVLRYVPEHEHYKIVGSCFVDGFMLGEVRDAVKEGRVKVKRLTIG
ncbi:hypothetical protein PRZ48_011188 [Zasmidium cellare]|uniref:AAA+ ATPase domain-containing protein n=1 Tax=Zasmidium cellare TaxID=395010 RepID=A0ABR0EAP3_ZASCE|nr:hypothetical protein PRZ48_011188 [Zasmidium cellare]